MRSAKTLRVPLTEGSTASIAVPISSISATSAPEFSADRRADAGRHHVDPPFDGNRPAFEPGYLSAAFICSINASSEMRSA